ncbi:MAG: peptidyl-prolyl cis-trans isomerase [Candidatus Hydrogenedentes bacterium]|nr:peptidyl-prolyl cis-trans isomerase [Candidatus Hydrogenedentota bacterium]
MRNKNRTVKFLCIYELVYLLIIIVFITSCGKLGDPDTIKIARIDNEYITRGDLYKILREMDDKERPKISNRGDYLRVLNQYIDQRIKIPLGKKLAEEGKITLDREVAREHFFRQSGDEEQQLRDIWAMPIPEGDTITPLMQVYNLTPATLRAMKEYIEQETDKIYEKLLGEQAIAHLVAEDVKAGNIKVTKEELEREYNLKKDNFHIYERIKFRGIFVPTSVPQASKIASEYRKEIDNGKDFDSLIKEILSQKDSLLALPELNQVKIIESEIENNPNSARFRGFWSVAENAQPNDILGPVYLPEFRRLAQDEKGNPRAEIMPDSYVVLKVLEREPERTPTIDEVKHLLAPPILIAKKMEELRALHQVEIYEENLPDPSSSGDQFTNPWEEL